MGAQGWKLRRRRGLFGSKKGYVERILIVSFIQRRYRRRMGWDVNIYNIRCCFSVYRFLRPALPLCESIPHFVG